MTITEKVEALRLWMRKEHTELNVYIVPTSDPHGSEYIAPHWACREWLTGFTGSAGIAVVTLTEAFLWTDSRYWLQAERQLEGTPFKLMKIEKGWEFDMWLSSHFPNGTLHAGVPAELLDAPTMNSLINYNPEIFHEPVSTTLITREDAFATLWTDRPALPHAPIDVQNEEVAGETAYDKLMRLQEVLDEQCDDKGDLFLFNNLEDIAWLLNLRGADVDYNPVFIAYLTYEPKNADANTDEADFKLYTHIDTLTPAAREHLEDLGVELADYDSDELYEVFNNDKTRCAGNGPCGLMGNPYYLEFKNPVPAWRAIKNESEEAGFRKAMTYDGVAMVKFLRWLDEAMQQGERVTELSAAQKLHDLRAENKNFCGDSFATIAAYGPHGAIVHYEPDAESDAVLEPHGLFLLDSGGQYNSATTDITRTIALGPITDEERHINTLVMKGHLRLAAMHFPEGTVGLQLDTAARLDMWAEGYDFGHGTGHGVGARLCVHEGPQQIRKDDRSCTRIAFKPGMTITDEPGLYIEGKFGVRIENTLLCVPDRVTPFGSFLRFEVLTLCPYQLSSLDLSMLTAAEVEQINVYHRTVRERLMPLLTADADRMWLARATASIEAGEAE